MRWYGHVERRYEHQEIGGKRKRVRPRLRWKEGMEDELREKSRELGGNTR